MFFSWPPPRETRRASHYKDPITGPPLPPKASRTLPDVGSRASCPPCPLESPPHWRIRGTGLGAGCDWRRQGMREGLRQLQEIAVQGHERADMHRTAAVRPRRRSQDPTTLLPPHYPSALRRRLCVLRHMRGKRVSQSSASTAAATTRKALPAIFASVAVLAREAAHQQVHSTHQSRRRRGVRAPASRAAGKPDR
ncbi:hypothetical protein K523DRAFT_422214 [Schizophyllum commune Tattone D]|nr:hypothetical protein K523DRAFT_422214 [Schizophyllum commune Tattone D]